MVIANYITEYTSIDQLWFMITPQNPEKQQAALLPDHHRYEMVFKAVQNNPKWRASNFEFSLPRPSYTINTLTHLSEKYPTHEFCIVMGADNLATLKKWKNYEVILQNYNIIVYPRPGIEPTDLFNHPKVEITNAPLMEISASFIRDSIKSGKNISSFVPEVVWKYIDEMNFYKK